MAAAYLTSKVFPFFFLSLFLKPTTRVTAAAYLRPRVFFAFLFFCFFGKPTTRVTAVYLTPKVFFGVFSFFCFFGEPTTNLRTPAYLNSPRWSAFFCFFFWHLMPKVERITNSQKSYRGTVWFTVKMY